MSSIFISYSRKDTEAAQKLTEAFQRENLDFWIDWEAIPLTVDWWKEIEKGIEEADIFIFLISPDSTKSEVCGKEIAHAFKNAKRIIPIVVRDINNEERPSELSHLNFTFLRETDNFEVNFQKLIAAIKTDYDWVQAHRQIQVKALEWERSGFERSFLLRGKELQDAEHQLATNTSKEPHPTDLQRNYVHESRRAFDRQRGITTTVSIVGIIALALLAFYGFTQAALATANERDAVKNAATAQAASTLASYNESVAKENERTSRAGELAAKSAAVREKDFPVSLLLAIEAFNWKDTPQSRGALLDNAYANPQLFRYIAWNDSIITSVAFSPDGTLFASASEDGTISILNTSQFQLIQQLKGHTDKVTEIAFSPDGRTLASASKDGSVILWDTANFQPIGQPLAGHSNSVTSLSFSPDGKLLATGSEDQSVILWDVANHQPIGQPLTGNESGITSVAFSTDGRILATASGNGRVILWNTQNYSSFTYSVNSYVYDVAFQPNKNTLAVATCGKTAANGFCSQGKIILLDAVSRQIIGQPLIGHNDYVNNVVFSPDGSILASGSWDKTIILWDMNSLQPLARPLYGHISNVNSIAFSPGGRFFASGGGDKAVILWDVRPHQPVGRQFDLGHQVASMAITNDGKHFATGSNNGIVHLWDATADPPTDTPLVGHAANFVTALAFRPGGKILATGGHDTTVRLWDVETAQPIGNPLTGHTELINALAFSPDGTMLASGSWDDQIILWDVSDPNNPVNIATLSGSSEDVISLAFSPDGKILASGYKGKELPGDIHENAVVILWDVSTRQMIGQPLAKHTDSVNSVVFSPDGKYLFSGSWDKTIIQWDVASQQPVEQFVGHIDLIFTVAVSSDGTMLASGGSDKTIILWDIATHQPIGQPLTLHNAEVISVAFRDNDKTLVSSSLDNTIIFWSLEPSVWIERTCQRVGRNFTQNEWEQYFLGEEYRKTCEQ